MKTLLATLLAVVFSASAVSVTYAADEKKSNPQQEKMKTCIRPGEGEEAGRGRAQGVHVGVLEAP